MNVYVRVFLIGNPSVVCLSVTFVRPTRELKLSAILLRHFVSWPSFDLRGKLYGDRPRGTPVGVLNVRRV